MKIRLIYNHNRLRTATATGTGISIWRTMTISVKSRKQSKRSSLPLASSNARPSKSKTVNCTNLGNEEYYESNDGAALAETYIANIQQRAQRSAPASTTSNASYERSANIKNNQISKKEYMKCAKRKRQSAEHEHNKPGKWMARNDKGFDWTNFDEAGSSCFLRAISLLFYGYQFMYDAVRRQTMDYILQNRDYFSKLVCEDINSYVKRQRNVDACDKYIDLKTIPELYNPPTELYTCPGNSIKTFNKERSSTQNISNCNAVKKSRLLEPERGIIMKYDECTANKRRVLESANDVTNETIVQQPAVVENNCVEPATTTYSFYEELLRISYGDYTYMMQWEDELLQRVLAMCNVDFSTVKFCT